MVKNNYSSYFLLMDESWKQFTKAHGDCNPEYCIVSQDVEDFMDAEQIGFLCPVVTDAEMKPKSMCLVYVAV